MHRQILRSRTGCNRCKLRRKKCDERRPICSHCERLNLICGWGQDSHIPLSQDTSHQTAHDNTGGIQSSLIRRLPLSQNVSTGSPAFRDQTQIDLTVGFPLIFRSTVAPTASPEFHDLSMFVTIALHHEGARNALAAAAGSLLYMEKQEPAVSHAALESYQQAVIVLRRSIAQGLKGQDLTALYVMAEGLGMIEACGLGNPQIAACHFAAGASFWSRAVRENFAEEKNKVLCKCAGETWLFFLGTLVIFLNSAEIDQVSACMDWSALEAIFQKPASPSLPACAKSPHLVIDHSVFRLIIQITHFTRQNVTDSIRLQKLTAWLAEVDLLDSSLESTFTDIAQELAVVLRQLTRIYLCTLRIFLTKSRAPESCSSSPVIRSSFIKARHDLEELHLQDAEINMCWWPFLVLLCAAGDSQIVESLAERARNSRLDTGFLRMMDRILEAIRKLSTRTPCSGQNVCSRRHDGLDVLTQKEGLPALEQEQPIIYETLAVSPYRPYSIGIWKLMQH